MNLVINSIAFIIYTVIIIILLNFYSIIISIVHRPNH